MQTKRLEKRQLFHMLGSNLEKRIIHFYRETKDSSLTIEYVVAVLVRQALTVSVTDFSCRELIKELFLNAAPNNTLRRFSVFFESYFDPRELETIVARLYRDPNDFLSATEEACLYREYLKEKDATRTDDLADHQFILKAIFKGANGRKHTWTLKNAHPTKNREEVSGALKILTMLTIFETNGIRKFTEFVDFNRDATKLDLQYIEEQPESNKDIPEKSKRNKNASGKMKNKQPEKQSIESSEDHKSVPDKRNHEDPAVKQSILSGRDPNESTGQTMAKQAIKAEGTMAHDLSQEEPPNAPSSRDNKQKDSDTGNPKKEQKTGKNKEQKEEKKFRNRVAKYLKKRGKK